MLLYSGCAASQPSAPGQGGSEGSDTLSSPLAETPEPETSEEPPVQIPDFEMTFSDGETASFADYHGKKILLNFWATWCGPCVGEMPAFQRLAEEYPDDLMILAVNCGESRETVQKFMEDNSYTFPVVTDEEGDIQALFGGITSIPLTVIVDEEGCVVTSHLGASDADTMYETYKESLGL